MIEMSTNYYEEAKNKVKADIGKIKESRAKLMASSVADALCDFAKQNNEFAQAIVQGGSFIGCMTAVAKGVGNSISDLEAYRRAVNYYFPTALVNFSMTINTEGNNSLDNSAQGKERSCVNMSLDDLLEM